MSTITANLKNGEKIFDNIEEYPMPQKSGVKDYVFYLVSLSHGYGLGANTFFKKYYSSHIEKFIPKEDRSLETIIEILHTEIQQNTIDHIREIVIVSHANERELLFAVTRHAFDNSENKSKYQIVRAGTLVNLQEAFNADDPDLKSFKDKRKLVIAKLTDTSRVTIRACNFGSSRDGLFALFSFFGGRTNIYAPNEYQFFLDKLGVGMNSRLISDLDFYQHLVKQGFISRKTKHSESRKVKVIKKLIEPGRSRHRFELSNYTIRNSMVTNGDKVEYDSFVLAFDQRSVPEGVRERFVNQDLSLSGDELLRIKKNGERWVLFDDRLVINDHTYKIEYTIEVEHDHFVDENNHQASLFVYPVLNHRKSLPVIPIQLFFNDQQNDDFKGQLFELASYSTIPEHGVDADAKAIFDAYVKLLELGVADDDEGHDLKAIFKTEGYSLTKPTINQLPPKGNKKRWGLLDEILVSIKEEVENLPSGDQLFTLIIEYDENERELASYGIIDGHITTADEKANYDAFAKLLSEGKLKDRTGHNLVTAIFGDTAITNLSIKNLSSVEGQKQWELRCALVYEINETFDYIYPEGFNICLDVFQPITRERRLNFYKTGGSDPDNPGTELMAYLDNLSLEELYNLVHYLRKSYRKENALYIYMAQEAMRRKSAFLDWGVRKGEDEKGINDPIYIFPSWAVLNDVEREDKLQFAYHFENVWREVKASTTRNIAFENDLFEERKLPFSPITINQVVDPDTPENEDEILTQNPNNPVSTPDPPEEFFEKEMVFQEIRQEDISCQKFEETLEVIKQSGSNNLEDIEGILKETQVSWPDGAGTLYDYLKADHGLNSIMLTLELLGNFEPYAASSGLIGRLGVLANSRWIFLGSVAFNAIAGPLMMMKAHFEEISKGADEYERVGIITGLKQGNRMIFSIMFQYTYKGIAIDNSYDLTINARDHFDAYFYFGRGRLKTPFPSWLEAHKRGYKTGLKEVNNVLNEDLRRYDYIFKKYVLEKGLNECYFKVLQNSGLIDENMIKLAILQGLYYQISKIARYESIKTE